MAGPRPTINLGAILTAVQAVQVASNINWKGYGQVFSGLKDYWGRLLLIGGAALIVCFVVYDWRRAHVEKLEAQAAVIAITAERDTLVREKNAELIARAQRAEDLANLSADQVEALAQVKEIMEGQQDYASQPIPQALRDRIGK